MHTTLILLKTIWQNINFILPILLFFLDTSFVGYIFSKAIIDVKDKKILVPLGVVIGVFGFILYLALFSYLFKGSLGIWLILIIYNSSAPLIYRRLKIHFKPHFKLTQVPYTIFYSLLPIFLTFASGNNILGGDVIAYWGFATSFGNGNYPLHSPWQPDLLANHHQGAFLYEGAVQALTGADMRLVHCLFGVLVISAGFYLLYGLVHQRIKNAILSVIPSFITYFSFGAIYLPLPDSIKKYLPLEVDHIIQGTPLMINAKDRLGGASTLGDFLYINHRAAALAGVIALLTIALSGLKISPRLKVLVLAVLSVPVISADEVFLPAIGLGLFGWYLYQFVKSSSKKKYLIYGLTGLIAFVAVFLLTGSAIRDSLFTPSPQGPRFKLVTDVTSLSYRTRGLLGAGLAFDKTNWFLYVPDERVLLVLTLVLTWLTKDELAWGLMLLNGGFLVAYYFIEHTFYPGNEGRFLNLIYELLSVNLAYDLLVFIERTSSLKKILLIVLVVAGFVPAIILSSIYYGQHAKSDHYDELRGTLVDYPVLAWSKKNLAHNRIFFIDGFLRDVSFSYLSLYGTQNFGLLVPISPAHYRVHTPDFGPEAVDVINTLNPQPLKELKVEYLFVASNQLKYYQNNRVSDLDNPEYFIKVYQDPLGVMYKIRPKFLNQAANTGPMLTDLSTLIPESSSVYIDTPPKLNYYVRGPIMLQIKESRSLYTIWGPGTFNYIETKIPGQLPSINDKYQYLILGPKTDPLSVCNCQAVTKIWQIPQAIVYRVDK